MAFKRFFLDKLEKRIRQPRQFIQVLTGPRQVGKTTIVRQLCDITKIPHKYITADGIDNPLTWIDQNWENARLKLDNKQVEEFLLIIDEIQKIENWNETVKRLWDEDTFKKRNLKVILLGSSGLLIHQGLNESLAGRFEVTKITHWSYTEIKECFGLTSQQYAWFGGYPGSIPLIDDEERWKNYVKDALIETTISKDILMLVSVHKPALMKQVFEMGVQYSSQILSFNKMLGQLQDAGNTVTISHYLKLLDVAGLLTGLNKFYVEKHRVKASSPKWQVKNTALISALSNLTFDEVIVDSVRWGQIVESTIGAHLINNAEAGGYEVFYWRHRNEEVDFVLRKDEKVIGIEVKSSFSRPTKGMQSFKEKYQPYRILLIGGSGLSWEEFIEINPKDLFN